MGDQLPQISSRRNHELLKVAPSFVLQKININQGKGPSKFNEITRIRGLSYVILFFQFFSSVCKIG